MVRWIGIGGWRGVGVFWGEGVKSPSLTKKCFAYRKQECKIPGLAAFNSMGVWRPRLAWQGVSSQFLSFSEIKAGPRLIENTSKMKRSLFSIGGLACFVKDTEDILCDVLTAEELTSRFRRPSLSRRGRAKHLHTVKPLHFNLKMLSALTEVRAPNFMSFDMFTEELNPPDCPTD